MTVKRPKKVCIICGEFKETWAKGKCRLCYAKDPDRMRRYNERRRARRPLNTKSPTYISDVILLKKF